MLQSQSWRWILPDLGPMTLTGFAVCARTFVRTDFYAQDHTLCSPSRDSYGVLAANENELAARAFKRVSVLVLVLWSWVLVL